MNFVVINSLIGINKKLNEMKKYKIKEEIFEDGRSEFTPQFEESGKFHDFFYLSGVNYDRLPMITIKFDTFNEAIEKVNADKRNSETPISTKIHDVD